VRPNITSVEVAMMAPNLVYLVIVKVLLQGGDELTRVQASGPILRAGAGRCLFDAALKDSSSAVGAARNPPLAHQLLMRTA